MPVSPGRSTTGWAWPKPRWSRWRDISPATSVPPASASTWSRPDRSARWRREGSPDSSSWPICGPPRRRWAGTSRIPRRWPVPSAFCSLITRVPSLARSCTSTAAFTPWALRSSPDPASYAQSMDRWLSDERNVRICAVLGAMAIAFSSILVRLSHASPSTAAIFRCAYALPVLGLLAWLEDRRFDGRSWTERRWALGSGVFFAADLLLWHHSIRDIGAGLGTVLANIQVVLVPLVAWAWLSERPGRRL